MQTQQSPLFGETESAIVQDSLEPIKWHHVIYLLLNRHDTLIFKLQKFASKAKITISKLMFHSNSTFSNTANGCTLKGHVTKWQPLGF
jgi:hypothetical protein